jgi:hypothetical protein
VTIVVCSGQVVEYVFMLQELAKDFKREKYLYMLAKRRRKERTKSIYKEKWMEKFDLFKRVAYYGKLREQYLIKKKGFDMQIFPWTVFMAEVGWETRYAALFEQPDSWASLFCADIVRRDLAAEQEKRAGPEGSKA